MMIRRKKKTYNSGDSLVVTHLTTNPPVHCLYMAERTGSLVFNVLWSYVVLFVSTTSYIVGCAVVESRVLRLALPFELLNK